MRTSFNRRRRVIFRSNVTPTAIRGTRLALLYYARCDGRPKLRHSARIDDDNRQRIGENMQRDRRRHTLDKNRTDRQTPTGSDDGRGREFGARIRRRRRRPTPTRPDRPRIGLVTKGASKKSVTKRGLREASKYIQYNYIHAKNEKTQTPTENPGLPIHETQPLTDCLITVSLGCK